MAGCGALDDSINLGKGYELRREGPNYNYIIGQIRVAANIDSFSYNDRYIFLHQTVQRQEYLYFVMDLLSTSYILHTNKGNEKTIPDYDHIFIKNDSTLVELMLNNGYGGLNDQKDNIILKRITDSLLTNDDFHKKILSMKYLYWIIDKEKNRLYGPFTQIQFTGKAKEIGVKINMDAVK